jgi:hypothetical protein
VSLTFSFEFKEMKDLKTDLLGIGVKTTDLRIPASWRDGTRVRK